MANKKSFFIELLKEVINNKTRLVGFTLAGLVVATVISFSMAVKYDYTTNIYIARWEKHKSYKVGDFVMVEEPGYARQFARENKAVVDELLHNIVPEVIGKRIAAGEEIGKKYVAVDRPKGISFIKLISRGSAAEKGKIATIHKEIAEKTITLYSPIVKANRRISTGKATLLQEKTELIKKEIGSLARQKKLLKQKGDNPDTLVQIAIERLTEKIADKKIKLVSARLALNDALYSVESFVDTHYTPVTRSIYPVSPNRPLLIVFGAITGFLLALHLIAFNVIREKL